MSVAAHVFVTLLILPCVAFILRMVRKRQLRAKYSMLWLTVGMVMVLFAAVPGFVDRVASGVGVSYPPALLFMAAIMLLLLIAVHFSWELSRMEERVRTLAETLAIHEAEAALRHGPESPGATTVVDDSRLVHH